MKTAQEYKLKLKPKFQIGDIIVPGKDSGSYTEVLEITAVGIDYYIVRRHDTPTENSEIMQSISITDTSYTKKELLISVDKALEAVYSCISIYDEPYPDAVLERLKRKLEQAAAEER